MMSEDDWEEVERRLKVIGYPVILDCDGYRLAIYRARLKEMRDCLTIYVNGAYDFKWGQEDCEERRRFLCARKVYFRKPKERARLKAMKKGLRRSLERDFPVLFNPDHKITYYSGQWGSFKALKGHLIKNNQEITLVKEEAYAVWRM